MLIVAASILTFLTVAALLFSGLLGVLVALFSKPIIDATWDYQFGGVNLLQIVGVLLPIIVLFRGVSADYRLGQMPFFGIWVVYALYNAITYSFVAFERSFLASLDLTFRMLNGLAGYYMLQAYFTEPERFRRLVVVLIFAGAFPMLIGLYQALTGHVWREQFTVGLTRYSGLYHDVQSMRLVAFQTLTAIVLYLACFSPRGGGGMRKWALIAFGCVTILVIYKTYSKAAMVVVGLWLVMWTLSYRRIAPTIGIVLAGTAIMTFYHEEIVKEIGQLFSKELTAAEAEGLDEEALQRTLAGRWLGWFAAMENFRGRSLLEQLFGMGHGFNIHNDYLAKLLSGGIVGLLIYLWLLAAIGRRLVANWARRRAPLDVMALMIFAMLLIDSIGIHATLYTSYQWYVWGFIGLALRGIEPEKTGSAVPDARPRVAVPMRPGQAA